MTAKPARNHHYVPQFYLRNFSRHDKVLAFNTEIAKLFKTTPRNIASERDLYKLEGSDPQLAETMFGEIETALTPILAQIISSKKLPPEDSDDFVSLLYFVAILVVRHPGQLTKIEDFMKTVMARSVEVFAHHIPSQGKKLVDGQVVTPQQAKEAVDAFNSGRIRIHIPRDRSLATSLKTAETIAETLMRRSWTLAKTKGDNHFITSSRPVLLIWDDLSMHERYSVGFGLKSTTVYFPISPELAIIGKFAKLVEECLLDKNAVTAINGLHLLYSPQYLISRDGASTVHVASKPFEFKDLEAAFAAFKDYDNTTKA